MISNRMFRLVRIFLHLMMTSLSLSAPNNLPAPINIGDVEVHLTLYAFHSFLVKYLAECCISQYQSLISLLIMKLYSPLLGVTFPIQIMSVSAAKYLNVSVSAAANGTSILECWQLTTPFTVSNQSGTAGAMLLQLGNLEKASYSVIPAGVNDGYHTAPANQSIYPPLAISPPINPLLTCKQVCGPARWLSKALRPGARARRRDISREELSTHRCGYRGC